MTKMMIKINAQKLSFPLRISSVNVTISAGNCRKPQETADFVTFTDEILNGKLHFLGIA